MVKTTKIFDLEPVFQKDQKSHFLEKIFYVKNLIYGQPLVNFYLKEYITRNVFSVSKKILNYAWRRLDHFTPKNRYFCQKSIFLQVFKVFTTHVIVIKVVPREKWDDFDTSMSRFGYTHKKK